MESNDDLIKSIKGVGDIPIMIPKAMKTIGEAAQGAYEKYGKPALQHLGTIKENPDGSKTVGEPVPTAPITGFERQEAINRGRVAREEAIRRGRGQ